jgi:ubiquinone/menaquinone biosynthesis C-methylase UbiE
MQTTLSEAQTEEVRQELLGPCSDELIDLIVRLNLSQPAGELSQAVVEAASRLGWATFDAKPQLSPLGWLVADPLREYRMWLDRDRRIHGEGDSVLLAPESYAGKAVLEVGSGFGCNLLSLSRRTHGKFVGVEPMAIYRQFTPLLAAREGVEAPEVVDGAGEALPFGDRQFDIVLCYSAHQYMDIRKALQEMARVLKPGGQLQVIGGSLDSYSEGLGQNLIKHPSASRILNGVRTLVNTLSYQWLGRRMFLPASAFATAAPIYPSRTNMYRWIATTGLTVRHDLVQRVGEETCFVADKF